MKYKWALVPLAALVAVGLYVGNVLATPAGGQTTTTLGKALAAGPVNISGHAKQPPGGWRAKLHTHGLSDFYVIDNRFDVGGTSGWHSHPGPPDLRRGRPDHQLPRRRPELHASRLQRRAVVHGRGWNARAHASEQRHGAGRDDRGAVPAEGCDPPDRRGRSAELSLLGS